MNYTKGNEWRVRSGTLNKKEIFITCGSVDIAKVFWQLPNAEANAHLIAKAPRMYEACMKALAITANVVNMPITPQRRIVALLSKAIAPVEGGKK